MKPISLYIAILVIAVTSCKTVHLNTEKPASGDLVTKPERKVSEIIIPFAVSLDSITKLVNSKLPRGVIASDKGSKGNTTRFSYRVMRNDPVTVSSSGNEIIFKVPIRIEAEGSYTACIGFWRNGKCCSSPNPFDSGCLTSGVTETEHGNASPTVNVELRVALDVDSTYNIHAKTYLKGVLGGDTHLHIDLIGNLIRINIDIKDKLEKPLRDFVRNYQEQINKQVADLARSIDLKNELKKYWDQLKQPVRKGPAYVSFQPRRVLFENISISDNLMKLAIGLQGALEISDIPVTTPADTLPNLRLITNAQPSFFIYLPVGASFATIDSVLNKSFAGKKFRKDKDWVVINGVRNYGVRLEQASAIVTELDIKAKAKGIRARGKLYFTSIPAVDTVNKVIFIQDFRLTPNTSSVIVNKGVPFLLNNFYYDNLKKQMRYEYREMVDRYLAIANEYISHLTLGPVVLTGRVDALETYGFFIDERGIEVIVAAKGKLEGTVLVE